MTMMRWQGLSVALIAQKLDKAAASSAQRPRHALIQRRQKWTKQVPNAMAFLGDTARILLTSGLLPAAFIAIVSNLVLPEDLG